MSIERIDLATVRVPLDDALAQAPRLLAELRDAPALPEGHPPALDGWQGLRETSSENGPSIACWNGPLTVAGQWRDGALDSWIVADGDRFRAFRRDGDGAMRLDSDGTVEGSAAGRWFVDLTRRSREALAEWHEQHDVMRWICRVCSWQNEPRDRVCALCGAAVRPGPAEPADLLPDEPSPPPPLRSVLALPPDLEELLQWRAARVPAAARSAMHGHSANETAAADPQAERYEVVLHHLPPGGASAVLSVLHELRLSWREPPRQPRIEGLPATLDGGLTIDRARMLQQRLAALGARAEVKKERS
jgi:hypothetical protein